MEDHDLRLLLPPGTITYPCNTAAGGTTIDLVFGNEKAEECMLKCQISADNDHVSDHLPIETILDLFTRPLPPTEPAYNYEKTKWKLLETKLKEYLPETIDPDCTTPTQLDQFSTNLTNAIKQAIDETTPRKRPSPSTKKGGTKKPTNLEGKRTEKGKKGNRKGNTRKRKNTRTKGG